MGRHFRQVVREWAEQTAHNGSVRATNVQQYGGFGAYRQRRACGWVSTPLVLLSHTTSELQMGQRRTRSALIPAHPLALFCAFSPFGRFSIP